MYFLISDFIIPSFIALVKKDRIFALPIKGRGEDILSQIVVMTKTSNFSWKKIKGIIIISDSESFTQTRIMVTVANVLGEFFNLPRSFIKVGKNEKLEKIIRRGIKKLKDKPVFPIYNKKPNITLRNR